MLAAIDGLVVEVEEGLFALGYVVLASEGDAGHRDESTTDRLHLAADVYAHVPQRFELVIPS